MKAIVATLATFCVAAPAGTIIYLNHQTAPPAVSAPPLAQTEETPPETNLVARPESPAPAAPGASEPRPAPASEPASSGFKPETAASSLSQALDTLISAQTGTKERWKMLNQLKDSGQLDQAIAELKQRMAGNPADAEIPMALGEALMQKFPVQDFNEAAILGLQVDQNFDAALKADPANWEAEYYKAYSMSFWPDVAGKGPEVIQRLTDLIAQQDTMAPQPQFADTYVLLGDQYKKAGKLDEAQQTWQTGAQKFPDDPSLQQRIAAAAGR